MAESGAGVNIPRPPMGDGREGYLKGSELRGVKGPEWQDMTASGIDRAAHGFVESPLGQAVVTDIGGESKLKGAAKWVGGKLRDAAVHAKDNWKEMAAGSAVGAGTKLAVQAGLIASGLEAYMLGATAAGGGASAAFKEFRKITKEEEGSPEASEKRAALKRVMRNKARLGRATVYGAGMAVAGYYVGHDLAPAALELFKEYTGLDIKEVAQVAAGKVQEYFSVSTARAADLESVSGDSSGVASSPELAKQNLVASEEGIGASLKSPDTVNLQAPGIESGPATPPDKGLNWWDPRRLIAPQVAPYHPIIPDSVEPALGLDPETHKPIGVRTDAPAVTTTPSLPTGTEPPQPEFPGEDPAAGKPDFYEPVHSQPAPRLDTQGNPTFGPNGTANPEYDPNWHEKGGVAPVAAPAPFLGSDGPDGGDAGFRPTYPEKIVLAEGDNPWKAAENLLKRVNPDHVPTDAQIMAVDKALIAAQVDETGKPRIAVPEWGMKGETSANNLPVGTELKITDEVKQAIKEQLGIPDSVEQLSTPSKPSLPSVAQITPFLRPDEDLDIPSGPRGFVIPETGLNTREDLDIPSAPRNFVSREVPSFLNENIVIDHKGDTVWESINVDEGWRNENGVTRGDVVKDLVRQFAKANGHNVDIVNVGENFKLGDILNEDQIEVIKEANSTKDTGEYWFKVRPHFLDELAKNTVKKAA